MYFLPEHRAPVVRGNHLGSLLPLSLRRVYKHVHKRARARVRTRICTRGGKYACRIPVAPRPLYYV